MTPEMTSGTTFHEAIDPLRRDALTEEFVRLLAERNQEATDFEVRHDFVGCIAAKGIRG